MYKNRTIAVVVPAFNEERFISEVVDTMPPFVDRIYVVNDASTDNTANVLNSIRESRLAVINHERRSGAGAAMLTGYRRACAEQMDIVAIMAGDGQMDPAILCNILDPVLDGQADYCKGDRLSVNGYSSRMPVWRQFGNRLLTYIVRVSSGYWHISDPLNGYTAVTRQALERLDLDRIEHGYAFETDLLIKLGALNARVVNVDMPARYRNEKSKIVYLHFMTYTSWVILRDYIWRLWKKHTAGRPAGMRQKEREAC